MRRPIVIQLVMLFAAASMLSAPTRLQSGDAYVRREANEWVMGSITAERRVRVDRGQLHLVSLRNKVTGRGYEDSTTPPEEIRFSPDGEDVTA